MWLYLRITLLLAQVANEDNDLPFIIVRDEGKKTKIHGTDVINHSIRAAHTVSGIVKTSLGYHCLDKTLKPSYGDITVTKNMATTFA